MTSFLLLLRFGWMLVLSLYKDGYLHILEYVSYWLHDCCS